MASNKDLVNQYVDDMNQGRLNQLNALGDNYKIHEPVDGDLDKKGFAKMIGGYRKAFPDFKMTSDELVEAGERVLHRWTVHGTHKGDLRGMSPTNRKVEIHGISVL